MIPHTSKSLFSIFCGRLPMMQRRNLEAASNAPLQCLPALLAEAGYQSIFMQSALGSFEDRPRLVEHLGYQSFLAWEDIQGEPLGYLASDDESPAPALERWLDKRSEQTPFLATLLTSATHHPYRLSKVARARAEERGLSTGSDQQRYARLVEAEDVMLGALDEILSRRDLKKNTVIVVVGDHGEGFGANGVKQHDNNFYEEGLRVPLVMAGPGVPVGVVENNTSLLDIVPTIFDVLGLKLEPAVSQALLGASVLGPVHEQKKSYFACYYDEYCYGYVAGATKLIVSKGRTSAWYFDLANYPNELVSKRLTAKLRATLPDMFRIVNGHLSPEPRLLPQLRSSYGVWRCEEDHGCRHPKSPSGRFFSAKDKQGRPKEKARSE
ncbi:MAG: sulfatase-like hydrolase/transferase [Myxococcales bacterium]|nr:sulfatase-like hydrolase/transferase [Myxococcales bacterium]